MKAWCILTIAVMATGCVHPFDWLGGESPVDTLVAKPQPNGEWPDFSVISPPAAPRPDDWKRDDRVAKVVHRIKALHPKIAEEKAVEYAGLFVKYSHYYNLDVSLLVHICFIESRFEQDAISRTGDYGLMQINWISHRNNLRRIGIDKEMLLEPETNIDYACWFISELAKDTNSLYGLIKRFSPARARYYTNKLERLMADAGI